MAPIYLGGCLRAWAERRRTAAAAESDSGDSGILAASGLVAGEGLAGVLVAALVAFGAAPRSLPPRISGPVGEAITVAVLLAIAAFLLRAARPASTPHAT